MQGVSHPALVDPCDVYLKGAGRGAGSGKLRSGEERGGVWASAASVAPASMLFLLASAWALNAVEDFRSFGSHTRSCLPPRSPHPRHLQTSRSLPDHAYTRIRCTCSPTKERADQAVPYSLLPSPYILHPTPTSNPTPYTLHPAPCSLHATRYSLHATPYTHKQPYSLLPTPYSLHATRYSLLPQASRVTSNPTCLCA